MERIKFVKDHLGNWTITVGTTVVGYIYKMLNDKNRIEKHLMVYGIYWGIVKAQPEVIKIIRVKYWEVQHNANTYQEFNQKSK